METREPTKEEFEKIIADLRAAHEERCGPMLIALHERLTAPQRRAFFDPCYVPAAMNNFTYCRKFEPEGGVFANKGVLAHTFCIMEATTRTPCWVVRFHIGEDKRLNKQGDSRFAKIGKVKPAMVKVLTELGESILEGCGGRTHTRMSESRKHFFLYRPFTPHERNLAFAPFLNTPGVKIGPINVIELAEAKDEADGS